MLQNIYNQKITVLNRLKRADVPGGSKVDVWYKTTVDEVAWYTDSARNSGGNGVYIGTYITVLILFGKGYIPYREWKDMESHETGFTMSSGDYIILGEVEEEIDSSNIVEVMNKYGEDVCQVKHIQRPHKRFGAKVQLKIEGV